MYLINKLIPIFTLILLLLIILNLIILTNNLKSNLFLFMIK
jgi:hypothetical protein